MCYKYESIIPGWEWRKMFKFLLNLYKYNLKNKI